jgi:hypothetical protein
MRKPEHHPRLIGRSNQKVEFKNISDFLQYGIEFFLTKNQRIYLQKQGFLDAQFNLRYSGDMIVAESADDVPVILQNNFRFEKLMLFLMDGCPGGGKGYTGEKIKALFGLQSETPIKHFEGDAFLYTQVLYETPESLCGLLDVIGIKSRFQNGTPYALDILQKMVFTHRNQIFPTDKATFQKYYINYPLFKSFIGNTIKEYYRSSEKNITVPINQYVRSPDGNYLGSSPLTVNVNKQSRGAVGLVVDGVGSVNSFKNYLPGQTVKVVTAMPPLQNMLNLIARDGPNKERPGFRLTELKHLFFGFLLSVSSADIVVHDKAFDAFILRQAHNTETPHARALELMKQIVAEVQRICDTTGDPNLAGMAAGFEKYLKVA